MGGAGVKSQGQLGAVKCHSILLRARGVVAKETGARGESVRLLCLAVFAGRASEFGEEAWSRDEWEKTVAKCLGQIRF